MDCDLGCGDGCGDDDGGDRGGGRACSTARGCLSCSEGCDLLPDRKENRKKRKKRKLFHWSLDAADVVDRAALAALPADLVVRPMRWWSARRSGIAAIRLYQRRISPRLPTRCRYLPSCSAYGLAAVQSYGLITGSRLALGRIRRCTRHVPCGTRDPLRIQPAGSPA